MIYLISSLQYSLLIILDTRFFEQYNLVSKFSRSNLSWNINTYTWVSKKKKYTKNYLNIEFPVLVFTKTPTSLELLLRLDPQRFTKLLVDSNLYHFNSSLLNLADNVLFNSGYNSFFISYIGNSMFIDKHTLIMFNSVTKNIEGR